MPQDQQPKELTLEEFEERARARYRIPKPLWDVLADQESGGDVDAVSPTGVRGRRQVTKATASAYGLNRDDPFEAAVASARNLREGYDKYKGQFGDDNQRWLAASAYYYGGPDAVKPDGTFSTESKDRLSNPAAYTTKIAQRWKAYKDTRSSAAQTPQPVVRPQPAIPKPKPPRSPLDPARTERMMGMVTNHEALKRQGAKSVAAELAVEIKKEFGDVLEVGVGTAGWSYVKPKRGSGLNFDPTKLVPQKPFTPEEAEEQARQVKQRARTPQAGSFAGAVHQFAQPIIKGATALPEGLAELARSSKSQQEIDAERAKWLLTEMRARGMTPKEAEAEVSRRLNAMRQAEGGFMTGLRSVANRGAAYAESAFPVDPADQGFLSAKVPAALGGTVIPAAASLLLRSPVGGAVTGAGLNAQEIAREFDASGVDPARRDRAIMFAGATGLTEMFGVSRSLSKFGLNRAFVKRAVDILEESGQEGLQAYLNNVNAALVGAYDPNRPASRGVLESAVLGGVVGGGVQGLSAGAARLRGGQARTPQIPQAPGITPAAVSTPAPVAPQPAPVPRPVLESATAQTRAGRPQLPEEDAGLTSVRDYTGRIAEIERAIPEGPGREAAINEARQAYLASRRSALPGDVQQRLGQPETRFFPQQRTPEGAIISPPSSQELEPETFGYIPQRKALPPATGEEIIPTERLSRAVVERIGQPDPRFTPRPPSEQPTRELPAPTPVQPEAPSRPPSAPPIPDVNQRLIERTKAKAEQLIQQGQFDDAIAELQAHRRALRDAQAQARKAPGERTRLEREIGQVGNRLGDVRRMKQGASRQRKAQEQAPTAGLPRQRELLQSGDDVTRPIRTARPASERQPAEAQVRAETPVDAGMERVPAARQTSRPVGDQRSLARTPEALTPEPTNRITTGEGAELPRQPSQRLEGQPVEIPTRQPLTIAERRAAAQQRQIGRRREEREAAYKGVFGKFGEQARKTNAERSRPALAEHPELRKLLNLPEMPPYLDESGKVNPAWNEAAQDTLNAMAELGQVPRSSELDVEKLRGVYRRLQIAARSQGAEPENPRQPRFGKLSDDLKTAFRETVANAMEAQAGFERFVTDGRIDNVLRTLENAARENRQLSAREQAQLKASAIAVAKEHGLTKHFAENWIKQAADSTRRRAVERREQPSARDRKTGDQGDGGRDVSIEERATGTLGRPALLKESPKPLITPEPIKETKTKKAEEPPETPADRDAINARLEEISAQRRRLAMRPVHQVSYSPEELAKVDALDAEATSLRKQLKALSREADFERVRQEEARRQEQYAKDAERIAGLPVYQRRNGWEIVNDRGRYVVRDPHTKEDVWVGSSLKRAREVADESAPEAPKAEPKPEPPKAEPKATEEAPKAEPPAERKPRLTPGLPVRVEPTPSRGAPGLYALYNKREGTTGGTVGTLEEVMARANKENRRLMDADIGRLESILKDNEKKIDAAEKRLRRTYAARAQNKIRDEIKGLSEGSRDIREQVKELREGKRLAVHTEALEGETDPLRRRALEVKLAEIRKDPNAKALDKEIYDAAAEQIEMEARKAGLSATEAKSVSADVALRLTNAPASEIEGNWRANLKLKVEEVQKGNAQEKAQATVDAGLKKLRYLDEQRKKIYAHDFKSRVGAYKPENMSDFAEKILSQASEENAKAKPEEVKAGPLDVRFSGEYKPRGRDKAYVDVFIGEGEGTPFLRIEKQGNTADTYAIFTIDAQGKMGDIIESYKTLPGAKSSAEAYVNRLQGRKQGGEPVFRKPTPEIIKPTHDEETGIIVRSRREKPKAATGLTKSQEEYLAGKLESAVPTLARTQTSVTIPVPGDGRFTVETPRQANRLHKKITGEYIEGVQRPDFKEPAEGAPAESQPGESRPLASVQRGATKAERSKYWDTPPVPRTPSGFLLPLRPEQWAEQFEHSRAEFRQHATRARVYTNEQGAFTYAAVSNKVRTGRADDNPITVDGIALPIDHARKMTRYLLDRLAERHPPARKEVYNNLAYALEQAVRAADRRGDKAITIVSTEASLFDQMQGFRRSRQAVRQVATHEETHIWQMNVGGTMGRGLFSDEVITSDPDYQQQRRALINRNYPADMTPAEVSAEAVAHVAAGQWRDLGYQSEDNAMKYLARVLDRAYTELGADAVRSLRLRSPKAKEVQEHAERRGRVDRGMGEGPRAGEAAPINAPREVRGTGQSIRGREGDRQRSGEGARREVQGTEPAGRADEVRPLASVQRGGLDEAPDQFGIRKGYVRMIDATGKSVIVEGKPRVKSPQPATERAQAPPKQAAPKAATAPESQSGRDVRWYDYLRSPLSNLNYQGTYERLAGATGKEISEAFRQAQIAIAKNEDSRGKEIANLERTLRGHKQQLRADGKPGLANWLDEHVAALEDPDAAFRGLAGFLKAFQYHTKLRFNPRSIVVNELQPLQTLWPHLTTREFLTIAAQARRKATRERVAELAARESGGKVEEVDRSKKKLLPDPFSKVSESNRIMGHLAGELMANKLGLTGEAKARMAADWAKKVEFDNSRWDVPPLFRGRIASVVGQFKPFIVKNLERLHADWKETPQGSESGKLARRAKMITSQLVIGGVRSVLVPPLKEIGGVLILGGLAKAFMKAGMEDDDADKLAEAVYFGAPGLIEQDLSSSVMLLDSPFGATPYEKGINFLGGPTFSLIFKAWKEGQTMATAKDTAQSSREEKVKASALRLAKATTPYTKTAETAYSLATTGKPPKLRLGKEEVEMTKPEAIGYGLMGTPLRQTKYYEGEEAFDWQKRMLGEPTIKRLAGDTDRTYRERAKRVEVWTKRYEGALLRHPRYRAMSEPEQVKALETLRRRIETNANLRSPDVSQFNAADIIQATRESKQRKPERDRKKIVAAPD